MKRKIIPYNSKLKVLAKKLRKQGILSEVLLWKELKGKKLLGYDFHRQKPIDNFIVDFYCSELMLAIEIDGSTHNNKIEYDDIRQKRLESLGITVLRYYDGDVKQYLGNVVDNIKEWILKNTPRLPEGSHPSPEGNSGTSQTKTYTAFSKGIMYTFLLFCSFVLIQSCTDVPENVITNLSPETYLSLFPDSIISPQKTRIKITWWGDDPDGLVEGFRFSFDSLNWTFTPNNDSTFQLVIVGNDSTFRFWVSAVDDKGNIDPTPATNLYPVVNSPPSVIFNQGTEIPDTTFPVATFVWTGTDPDGDNTIKYYHWALNDTVNWHRVSGTTNTITLRQDSGIVVNSQNKLYLKAEDIAGTFSTIIKMPDSNRTWFVKPVIGNILIIDDYSNNIVDNAQASQFFTNALDTLPLNQYSILDIKVGGGANIPKIINPMFVETLKLFQCVIWYAGRGTTVINNANFDLAQQSLPFYLAFGGKVFFSTGFPNNIETQGNIINFAPADSVTNYAVPTMTTGTQTIVIDNNYPVLEVGNIFPENMRGVYPRLGAQTIYKMPFNPPYDTSKMITCIKDFITNPKIVFISTPLNRMNGNGNATYFLRRVIAVDFGIHN